MDIEEFMAQKKAARSVLWVHRHSIRKLRQGAMSWADMTEYLGSIGVRVTRSAVQQWYARQDWDKIDAELSPKPQAATARPAVQRQATPRPTPREPAQTTSSLGLVEKYAPNSQLSSDADDEDDNNPAHSVLAKFPGMAKRMQEIKSNGNQS